MRPELLEEALEHISDKHIGEAANSKKRLTMGWVSSVAAVLALVLLLQWIPLPFGADHSAAAPEAEAPAAMEAPAENVTAEEVESLSISGLYAVATASAPRVYAHPDRADYESAEAFSEAVEQWNIQRDVRTQAVDAVLDGATDFFADSCAAFLDSPAGENKVFSPVNSYVALAMRAEVTGGSTRQQILDVLNTPDLETLRRQVSALWESTYQKDEYATSSLANSLWLDEEVAYVQQTLDDLAKHHYASSYRGDLGSEEMNQVLRQWLNEQTGDLLSRPAGEVKMDPRTVLALASTAYLQAGWNDQFMEEDNTQAIFHAPTADLECTFMNAERRSTAYYQGENYDAICLGMAGGSGMWLFLPDEGTELTALLESGSYLRTIASKDDPNASQSALVNLSIPKFDVSSSADLVEGLQKLGVTEAFDPNSGDFSPCIDAEQALCVGSVKQAARVRIDEEGSEAASYTVVGVYGTGAIADAGTVIDFIADRPFLFVIEKEGLPMFAGTVNAP